MSSFARQLLHFDRSLISKRVALRDACAVAVALALGLALGGPVSGVLLAAGAMNASFADGPFAVRVRLMHISLAGLAVALAAIVGSLASNVFWFATAALAVWALFAGLLVALGPAAMGVGLNSLVVFIVFGRQPLDLAHAAGVAALLLAGSAVTMVFAALAVPSRTSPETRAVAAAYDHLAELAEKPADASRVPPLSAPLAEATAVLVAFGRTRGAADEPLRTLLDQAERLRVAIVSLESWRAAPGETPLPWATAIDAALAATATDVRAIARSLRDGRPVTAAGAGATSALAESASSPEADIDASPLAAAATRTIDAIAGQLRAAASAANETHAHAGFVTYARGALRVPVPPLRGALATLRANLSLESTAFRHALRLAACVALADTIERGFAIPHGYWIPMTAALVLKPDFSETLARGVMRIAGTLIGIVLAALLDRAAHGSDAGRIALVFFGVLGMRSIGRPHYGLLTMSVTVVVVEFLAFVGEHVGTTIEERSINTLIGGAVALAFYLLWPTWERRHAPALLAAMLDAYAAYWRAIVARIARGAGPDGEALDAIRLAARLARTNAEASIARMRAEPHRGHEVDIYAGVLASAHRLVLAGLRLEALAGTLDALPPAVAAYDDANAATLAALSAALRGTPLPPGGPDPREAQQTLARGVSGDALVYFAAEADTAANALGTMLHLLRRSERTGAVIRRARAIRRRRA